MSLSEKLVANFVQFPENHRHPLAQIGILLKLQPFEKSVPNGSNQLLAVLAALRDHSDTAVVILIFSTHDVRHPKQTLRASSLNS